MSSILRLDDFIVEDVRVEFQNELFTFNLSYSSLMKYIAWSKSIESDFTNINETKVCEILNIIIEEEHFVDKFMRLNRGSQAKILTRLLKEWVHLMELDNKNEEEVNTKKSSIYE